MKIKQVIIAVAVVLIVLGMYYGGLKDWISLQGLKENSQYFKDAVDRNYWFSVMIFVGIYTVTMAACLPIVGPFCLLGGFLFDVIPGACYSALSAAMGSMIYVIIFRRFFADSMQEQFKDQLVQFKENMQIYGKRYVLILHLMTVLPFLMINTLGGLSDLSIWDIGWTTIVGSGPLILIFSYEGRELAHIQSISDIFSPQFILALGLLALLACMPIIAQRFRGLVGK
jgi:uncharacterized membrane protein YdjX (TVP38/TMEM64 family)